MLLKIDEKASEPIYLQIRNQIIAGIAHGDLVTGDILPSVRRLAVDLGINLHTVNKAYAVLQDEGYVIMRGRAGTMIAPQKHDANQERMQAFAHLFESLQQLATECRALGGTQHDFLDLAIQAAQTQFAPSEASLSNTSRPATEGE